ncbi:MAG: 2OG-Fe dioxygenase family protein [Nitrosomonadales bacterium]|nr:2OG-Fe dioxygenase family protein [Nitrosomonadales bacterium]
MTIPIPPAYTTLQDMAPELRRRGYAVLSAQDLPSLLQCQQAELDALKGGWDELPPDNYLKDGGHYRRRRHSCFTLEAGALKQTPHRAHYQPLEYNALHGGMQRLFEPVPLQTVNLAPWTRLLLAIGGICSQVKPVQRWYVEAHQFRIDTTGGIGRPTPEGAHRDGVDFVSILLVDRANIKGGESRIFEAEGPNGMRFMLTEPWTLLILDDTRVIHETTPIQPLAEGGHRDTLVLTWRGGGFLEAAAG